MSENIPRQIRSDLDSVSPYTYLALVRAGEFARVNRVDWDLRPVVYAALLEANGLVGPVETPVKRELHDLTQEALERGVFGVPTFECDGEIFWGHDRLDHLAARLTGELVEFGPELEEIERRPSGATRRGSPG